MISIYVGNLPYDTTEQQLVELFSQHGEVHRASLVNDRETGRPRGFGFVEMPNQEEANRAVEALGGTDFHGRPLTVNEARRNTGRNTANLSRSAHRPDSDEVERGSTGYAAKPDTPKPSPTTDEADKSPVQDTGDDASGDSDETPTNGGYRNDRV